MCHKEMSGFGLHLSYPRCRVVIKRSQRAASTQGVIMDTYHGKRPGNCQDCKGTGYKYGSPAHQAGSCPHCNGAGSR
jgi:hypothetical protein